MAEALLTVHEVATLWRCHERTVRREIARGKLAATNIGTGTLTRISESALAAYVRNNSRTRKVAVR